MPEADLRPEDGRSSSSTRVGDLGLTVGKRFLYLFDFGDNNMFNVDVMDIRPAGPADNGSFPRLVESKGKAPEQYPDMDW
jgi:hypothetical protein